MYDCAIIGSGPAGLSAALNLKIHNKDFVWFGSRALSGKIALAEQISNYPGFINVSGRELNDAFLAQVEAMGLEIKESMINQIMPNGDSYALMAGSDFYEAKSLILATGVVMRNVLPGENELLGRGVSYCATCDGGLYRGKTIAVLSNNARFEHEVKYLSELASKIYFFPLYKEVASMPQNVETQSSRVVSIEGSARVEGIKTSDGEEIKIDGIFCLRDSISLDSLLPGLKTENGHIAVDRSMKTNLPGVFAAGDCTGRPYQYTKAAGEGNVAAHGVLEYLEK